MKKGSLLPTACWPNLQYLFYLAASSRVVIEQHETYPRQTYRNRYEVLSANGVLVLTVPVKRSGNHTKTKDVSIDYSSDWQIRHWRALTSAYRKSPFFEYFEDEIRKFYEERTDLLLDYNLHQLQLLKKIFRLPVDIELTESFEKNPADISDKRFTGDPAIKFDKEPEAFKVLSKEYYQTFREKFSFVPNLSSLDILFNAGLKARDYLQSKGLTS